MVTKIQYISFLSPDCFASSLRSCERKACEERTTWRESGNMDYRKSPSHLLQIQKKKRLLRSSQ